MTHNVDDNNGFTTMKSKKALKNDKKIQKSEDRLTAEEKEIIFKINPKEKQKSGYYEKSGSLNMWLTIKAVIDIDKRISEKFDNSYEGPVGPAYCLTDCLKKELFRLFPDEENSISYKIGDNIKGDIDSYIVDISSQYQVRIIIEPLLDDLISLVYEENACKYVIKLLHIGDNLFYIIRSNIDRTQYETPKNFLSDCSTVTVKENNNHTDIKREKENLDKLEKELIGKSFYENITTTYKENSNRRYFYNIKVEDYKNNNYVCTLTLIGAHYGKATPIELIPELENVSEIELIGRENCGFNAFNGDKVMVHIYDHKNYYGKVISVIESIHKPINTIYICRACADQGSLMKPLNGFIPKIHVENRPGRNNYMYELTKYNKKSVNNIVKSRHELQRTAENYADNKCYTLYTFKFKNGAKMGDKPEFLESDIVKFDPMTCKKLFLVMYEYWNQNFLYPQGRIVGVLSEPDSFNDSFHLIKSLCNIKPDKLDHVESEIKMIEELSSRNLCCSNYLPDDAVIFTIDGEFTEDMDDAISVHRTDGFIYIGVHISDVTKYISESYDLFKNALEKCFTYYVPHNLKREDLNLFPPELSSDLLSLKENEIKSVISVLFKFTEDILSNQSVDEKNSTLQYEVEYCCGNIKSQYKLNYRNVSYFLEGNIDIDLPDDINLRYALKISYAISRMLRKERIKHEYYLHDNKCLKPRFENNDEIAARNLIEEFMILANKSVAERLYESNDSTTLLRIQECSEINVKNNVDTLKNDVKQDHLIKFSRHFFETLEKLLKENNFFMIQNLLCNKNYINDFLYDNIRFQRSLKPAKYTCSEKRTEDNSIPESNKHYSLNLDLYTHFTSPIRRLPDIIVHLLLKSVLFDNNESQILTRNNIQEICNNANMKRVQNKQFEKLCTSYSIFQETNNYNCFVLDCIIETITDNDIAINNVLLNNSNCENRLKYNLLSLIETPTELRPESKRKTEPLLSCNFRWKMLIYSCEFNINDNDNQREIFREFVVPSDLYDVQLNRKMLQDARISEESKLKSKLKILFKKIKRQSFNQRICSDQIKYGDPYINIQYELNLRNNVRVQMCKIKSSGFYKISPELLIVTDTLQHCLYHHKEPESCFLLNGEIQFSSDSFVKEFHDLKQYKKYFLPLIQLESITEMISDDIEVTLIDVTLNWWINCAQSSKKHVYASFNLCEDFCFDRNIEYTGRKVDEEDEDDQISRVDRLEYILTEGFDCNFKDALCIRSQCRPENGDMTEIPKYWVGHGCVVNSGFWKKNRKDNTKEILVFKLNHSNFDLFKIPNFQSMKFTIDFYHQHTSSRRQFVAFNKIRMSPFLNDVVMGNEIPPFQIQQNVSSMKEYFEKHELNDDQREAINKAVSMKLSLIWGPPGTGKTFVGCLLSNYFINKSQTGDVILYCGPSNECVNVVAREMNKKFGIKAPNIIRIFGKQQEYADFPVPGVKTKKLSSLSDFVKDISLHHLIRNNNSKLAAFDKYFRIINSGDYANDAPHFSRRSVRQAVKAYKIILGKAKSDYIKKNLISMVLCTVSVTAKTLVGDFKVKQVIIDEAGMCKEPETLIPLTLKEAENFIMIGDHKQLRPIILNKFASNKGLGISLFERLQFMSNYNITMLTRQYRMHPSICQFPSRYFYSNKLVSQVSPTWTGLTKSDINDNYNYQDILTVKNAINTEFIKPKCLEAFKGNNYNIILDDQWMTIGKSYVSANDRFEYFERVDRVRFYHTSGEELVQSVSTLVGSERSRGNKNEVSKVGCLYKCLIRKLKSLGYNSEAPNYISVLTQYKLQEHLLTERCKEVLKEEKIDTEPKVQTVIRSQGSENDYVILSTVRSLVNKEDINNYPTPGWEKTYLGFITDEHQVNVALTRARKGLFIIGNKDLLRVNEMWGKLIENLEERNCCLNTIYDPEFSSWQI